jgi:peroxiredoxin
MITFRTTVAACVIGAVGFAGVAIGQVQEDAKAVLTTSAEAIKNLKDFSGSARYYATGPLLGGMLNTSGEFKVIRGADQASSPAFLKGSAKTVANPNEEVFHVSLAIENGQKNVTWIDDHAKVVYTAPLVIRTDAFNQLTKGQQILMGELFAPEPFRKELNAETLTLEPDADFDGEPCKVVRATYKNGETWAVWHISKNDNLPRKSDTGIKMAGHEEPVHVYFELTNFKANQGLAAKDLAIAVPEGYREDKQLATQPVMPGGDPANVPPPPVLGPDRAGGAPAFDLQTPEGTAVSLSSLRGNVVVLAFWGTWNGMSTRALPVLETIKKDFSDKPVKVFGAACREKDNQAPVDVMKEKNATFGLLLGGDDVAKAYKVRGFPSFAVIDAEGNVSEFIQGFRGEDDLQQRLTAAVNTALGETK